MLRHQLSLVTTSLFLLWLAACPARADLDLFSFTTEAVAARVRTNDAIASLTRNGEDASLRVVTGTKETWPGITLLPPESAWNIADFGHVAVTVRNPGPEELKLFCRVDNPGANGTDHCVNGALTLRPGASGELTVDLRRASGNRLGGKLFGMRGYPVAPGGASAINPSNVTQILLFVTRPGGPRSFEVSRVRATGTYTAPTAVVTHADAFFPFIDTFGQYRHADWPGKVHSQTELQQRRADEEKSLAADAGPADWDQYGGWKSGPQLDATGFFRVEKHAGKWWLVNPEGRLFWSHGIDCVRMIDVTPIDERAEWFQDFPGEQDEFLEFITSRAYALKGHYAGRSPACFSFAAANLKRKYGMEWTQMVPATIHRRLRSWGLNTIANWSDEKVRLMRRTPYTDSIGTRGAKDIEGSEGYWGKFPDPFDPGFRTAVRRGARARIGRSAGDPWCIGYFSDNEMSWGDDLSLAIATLKSPAGQAAKQEFVADLRRRHGGIESLNAAWGTKHESWDALLASREAPDAKRARQDLAAFYTRIAEAYFREVRDALREVAPKQLYLGCRFAWVNARAAAAAAKFCDVVSFNLYRRSVADFDFNGGADVPLIIGEFHFGALDRGMFHTGLVPVANQAARAEAYRSYVEGALRHPQFVGTHWFQYQDEPTTGRVYDEENYQIGFVDIADTPYRETIAASRAVAADMYRKRLGGDAGE